MPNGKFGDNPLTDIMKNPNRKIIAWLAYLLIAFASNAFAQQNLDSALIEAACANDFAKVKELLAAGANPNAKGTFYLDRTPLIEAASNNWGCMEKRIVLGESEKHDKLKTLRLLLDAGADVNLYYGGTALMWAAHTGEAESVKMLLDAGANVNIRDSDAGTNIQPRDQSGNTALSYFAMSGNNAEVVKMLVDAGADKASREEALVFVARFGASNWKNQVVGILLASNVGRKAKNNALMSAAGANDLNAANLLFAAGAEINARDEDGKTAAFYAAIRGSIEVFNKLRAAKADLQAKDNLGRNILMNIAGADAFDPDISLPIEQRIKIMKILVADGVDVNAKDKSGQTALMLAAIKGDPRIVKALIEAGARVNDKDKKGRTALALISREKYLNTKVITILKRAGAK